MKRKYGDRRDWPRVIDSSDEEREHPGGLPSLVTISAVRTPLWVTSCGERVCVVDAGFAWLTHYPRGASCSGTSISCRSTAWTRMVGPGTATCTRT